MLTIATSAGAGGPAAVGTDGGAEYIVRLAEGADAAALDALRGALGATCVETTQIWGFELWHCDSLIDAAALEACSGADWWGSATLSVEYLQSDLTLTAEAFSNDPADAKLWGFHNTGQTGGTPDADIDAPEAWETSRGAGVLVAVIDTGIDYTHPDLAANVWTNPGEIAGNGIDDDGNGFVDDVHGYDFANNDADPMDDNSHGTHVAGTIAAVADNGIGIAGVAPEAQVMALKFLGADGSGSVFDAIQALEYAVMMGAQVSNNSWSGASGGRALGDAIALAGAAGHVFVAAAGNDSSNSDVTARYPSGYDADNLIAVAATDASDRLASFSNYGFTTVDVAAPGVSIWSTLPGGGYGSKSGTSMATPHVSGTVALLLAAEPGLTPAEIRDRLIETSDPVAALASRSVSGGRINAAEALAAGATGTLSGQVRLADGTALAGWLVWLDTDGDRMRDADEAATLTGSDGRFGFAGLAAGDWQVMAEIAPGFAPAGLDTGYQVFAGDHAWTELAGRATRLDIGETGTVEFDPGFAVSVFGARFDHLTISEDGSLLLGDGASAVTVTPFGTDLTTAYGGSVLVAADAARGEVIVEYRQVHLADGSGGPFSFEAVLSADGSVQFLYGDMGTLPAASVALTGPGGAGVTLDAVAAVAAGSLTLGVPVALQAAQTVTVTAGSGAVADFEMTDSTRAFAETGRIASVGSTSQTIAFAGSYTNPVVFLLTDGSLPGQVVARVTGVTATGFTVLLQAPDGTPLPSGPVAMGFLVVEAGSWQLADGTLIEAGTTRVDEQPGAEGQQIGLATGFAETPLVFASVQTASGPDNVRVRVTGTDTAGFGFALEDGETTDTGSSETVGWLAVEPGGGTSGDTAWAAASGSGVIGLSAGVGSAPLILTGLTGTPGSDPAIATVTAVTGGTVQVTVAEDASLDAGTGQLPETVNLLAFSGTGTLAARPSAGQSVDGTLWHDADGDGLRDRGEAGIAGRTVWLDQDGDGARDAGEPWAVTAADGGYRFDGLLPGAYTLRQDLPAGWNGTGPARADTYLLGGDGGLASDSTAGAASLAAFDWVDAAAAPGAVEITGLGDDGWAVIDLPFLFPFFGTAEGAVTVSANGYLSFGGAGGAGANTALDTAALPGPVIAAFWDDLSTANGGRVWAWADPDAERVVIEWQGLSLYDGSGRYSFEAILDGDGTVTLQYLTMTGRTDGATAGIGSGIGGAVTLVEDQAGLDDGMVFVFTPQAAVADALDLIISPGGTAMAADFGSLPGAATGPVVSSLDSGHFAGLTEILAGSYDLG